MIKKEIILLSLLIVSLSTNIKPANEKHWANHTENNTPPDSNNSEKLQEFKLTPNRYRENNNNIGERFTDQVKKIDKTDPKITALENKMSSISEEWFLIKNKPNNYEDELKKTEEEITVIKNNQTKYEEKLNTINQNMIGEKKNIQKIEGNQNKFISDFTHEVDKLNIKTQKLYVENEANKLKIAGNKSDSDKKIAEQNSKIANLEQIKLALLENQTLMKENESIIKQYIHSVVGKCVFGICGITVVTYIIGKWITQKKKKLAKTKKGKILLAGKDKKTDEK